MQYTVDGLTSVTKLSRFENNKLDIGFNLLCVLLERIGISPHEYLSMVTRSGSRSATYEDKLTNLLFAKDSVGLAALALANLKLYRQQHRDDNLFRAASADNYYYYLTQKRILHDDDLEQLYKRISEFTLWSRKEINLFGNVTCIMPSRFTLAIAKVIIENLDAIGARSFGTYLDAVEALLNAQDGLIYQNIRDAEELTDHLFGISLPPASPFISLRRKFGRCLLEIAKGNKAGLADAQKILALLDECGEVELADGFRDSVVRVQRCR